MNCTPSNWFRSRPVDARELEQAAAVTGPRPESAPDGDVREVSIVMADLRGFTAFCERVPLDRMSRVLNEYLAAMVDVILGQQGRVQDFVGDGIMGVFGAPEDDPDHAWHAVRSAVEMQRAIRRLGCGWERAGGAAFALGVAVHSGRVLAGQVGPPRQAKYAVVGDPVNTAARLEELNRSLGTEIVISGDALALVEGRVDVQPRGLHSVRGRSHRVDVFELLGVHERAQVASERSVAREPAMRRSAPMLPSPLPAYAP